MLVVRRILHRLQLAVPVLLTGNHNGIECSAASMWPLFNRGRFTATLANIGTQCGGIYRRRFSQIQNATSMTQLVTPVSDCPFSKIVANCNAIYIKFSSTILANYWYVAV